MSLLLRLRSQAGPDTARRFADCNQPVKQLFLKEADCSASLLLALCWMRSPFRSSGDARLSPSTEVKLKQYNVFSPVTVWFKKMNHPQRPLVWAELVCRLILFTNCVLITDGYHPVLALVKTKLYLCCWPRENMNCCFSRILLLRFCLPWVKWPYIITGSLKLHWDLSKLCDILKSCALSLINFKPKEIAKEIPRAWVLLEWMRSWKWELQQSQGHEKTLRSLTHSSAHRLSFGGLGRVQGRSFC